MIEEDLYKKAGDELNSDQRKADIWARACALASDDHDEARYLYTNLRVEQMLEDRKAQGLPDLKSRAATQNDTESTFLELDDENAAKGPVWQSASPTATAVAETETALAIDDLLDLDENDTIDTSVGVLSPTSTTGNDNDTYQSQRNAAAIYDAEPLELDAQDAQIALPEDQKAEALAIDLKRQVGAIGHEGAIESVRADYDDTDDMSPDIMGAPALSELETGPGQPYLVFGRSGATKAIKQGVSWPALFFTFPWLVSRQLFGTAIVYALLWSVLVAGLLFTGFTWLDSGAAATTDMRLWTLAFGLLALVGLFFIPFIYGNSWVARKLLKRGYELKSVVKAKSRNDAISRLIRYAS